MSKHSYKGISKLRPPRVALLVCNLGQSGAEKQLVYIAQALASAGVEVRIYTLQKSGFYAAALRGAGIEIHCFGTVPFAPARLIALTAQLLSFRPDVVQSIPAFMNLYSGLAARAIGAISLGGLRSDLDTCRQEYGRLTPLLMRVCDAVAANSTSAYGELRDARIIAPDRIHMLANAIDTAPFRTMARPWRGGAFWALYLGRLVNTKRVDIYLRALAAARSRAPFIRGIIAGEGPELASLRNLASSLGLDDEHVSFAGHQSDILPLLQSASCLVLSSDAEGCPNVVLEAMAAGLPVITTPAGDASQIVEHARTGFVVPFADWESTAEAIVSLATSPQLALSMGSAGRNRIDRLYGSRHIAHHLLDIYAGIARRKGFAHHPILNYTPHHDSAKATCAH